MSRFDILDREAMSTRQREVADAIAAGPRGALKGPFLALIHQPELASRIQNLGEYLRFGTALTPRLLEIGVLITARRWSCDYEWAAHARIAREAGLEEHIIEAIAVRARPESLGSDEALMHDFAMQTAWDGVPGDAIYDAFTARFGASSALDVLSLCGYYTMLAFVLNAAQLPLPAGAKPLPPLTAG